MHNLNTATMNDGRTLELAKKIKEETEKKNLNWARATFSNSYRLSLGTGMVVIDYHPDGDMLPDGSSIPEYGLTIYHDRDAVLDSICAEDSKSENYDLLSQIYHLAENYYLKKDVTYVSMFNALNTISGK